MKEFSVSEIGKKRKALGSWFSSASVIKSDSIGKDEKITICLFYQYIKPLWSDERRNAAIQFIEKYGEILNIGGRIRVANEGINATLSSTDDQIRQFTSKLGEFDKHFLETDFKFITALPVDRAFKELRVLPVKELVFYGIDASMDLGPGGIHLPPQEYHKKLGSCNTVVIDVRNTYESDIGRFGGQKSLPGGAELIIPQMRKSTDFPSWLEKEETKERLKDKEVLMYCTGGVRCERASALLKTKLQGDVKGVYQLQGGVEKYLQEFPDGGYWQGKNYVFDKREAFSVDKPEGVGGVVSGEKKKKQKLVEEQDINKDNESSIKSKKEEEILGKCCACEEKWDRYLGKKKCTMCGVPILLCIHCCSKLGMLEKNPKPSENPLTENKNPTENKKNPKKTKKEEREKKTIENLKMLRCPLCVIENCTIPAADLHVTANGKKAIYEDAEGGRADLEINKQGKAATTVCKWGGGFSKREDKVRKRQGKIDKTHKSSISESGKLGKGKLDRPCRWGSHCNRDDCWFNHDL